MEKERFLGVNWQSLNAVMPPQMNSGAVADQLPQPFLNLVWEQPMPHDVQFESALSSLVSSQSSNPPAGNDTVAIRELIGRLGSVCYSGEISPSSANACCYSTPLSSSPKLNLTMMDHQQQCRGGLPMPGNPMEARQFAPFSANPGFAERVSCFGARSYGVLGGQFGLSEARKLSRVSSSQSLKAAGGPEMGVPGNGKEAPVSDPERSEMEMRSMYGGRMSSASTPDETEFGNGQDSSSASDRMPAGGTENNAKKRKAATRSKGKEAPFSSSNTYPPKSAEEETSNAKRCEPAETNGADKDAAVKPKTDQNDDAKPLEPPKDYIHVRARRGQATDSHSLAERVRREKITARMKLLQDLVPGCNKITGKAVMLDEIINYVQSLQRQVEFLSTKLATLNPHLGFNMENLLGKDMHQEHGPFPQQVYPLDITTTAFSYAQQPRGPPLQSVATGVLDMQASLSPLDSSLRPHPNMQLLPALDGFADTTSQLGNLWGDDLQYVVQMGLGQSQETSFSSQILHDE